MERSPELSYSLSLMPLRRVVLQNVLFSWRLCSRTTLRFLALSWKAAARNQISSAHLSQYVRHQTVRKFVPSQTNVPRKQTGGLVVAMIWSGSKQNKQLDILTSAHSQSLWCAQTLLETHFKPLLDRTSRPAEQRTLRRTGQMSPVAPCWLHVHIPAAPPSRMTAWWPQSTVRPLFFCVRG